MVVNEPRCAGMEFTDRVVKIWANVTNVNKFVNGAILYSSGPIEVEKITDLKLGFCTFGIKNENNCSIHLIMHSVAHSTVYILL